MSSLSYPSASRTATFTGDDNRRVPGDLGCKVVFDITAAPGVDTVLLTIQGKDLVSGKYYTILAGVAEVAAATRIYTVFPGITAAANVSASDVLPDVYRVTVTHSGVGIFTYSVRVTEL